MDDAPVGPARGYAVKSCDPFEVVFIGWPPARDFHHGPENLLSTSEAGDTGAVDQSFNAGPVAAG